MQKRTRLILSACTSAALICASPMAFGQTSSSSPSSSPASMGMSSGSDSNSTDTSASQNLVLGSKVMNCQVKNQQGQNLGSISNVVVNPQTGHIRYAVVNADGKKVAVPWSALNFDNTGSDSGTPKCTLNTTKEKLSNAPKFDSKNLASLSNRSTEEPIYTYYELIYFPDVMTTQEQNARNNKSGSMTSSGTSDTAVTTGSIGSMPSASASPGYGTTPSTNPTSTPHR